MPAPQPTPGGLSGGVGQLLQGLLEKNITKTGVVGGGIYVAAQVALGIIHKSWDTIFQAVGYAGLLTAIGGAAFRAKKTTDILVASEAEKRIDPLHPTLPSSTVPAIQREIEKQVDEKRNTPSNGTPTV